MEGAFCDVRTNEVRHPVEGREAVAWLCREFGISRKTGYTILTVRSNADWEGYPYLRYGQVNFGRGDRI
jgi:hypothetical protein